MQTNWQLGTLAAIIVAALAGCYSPSIADCSLVCGAGGSCPDGTQCGPDNRCHQGALDTCVFDIDAAPSAIDAGPGLIDARVVPDARPPADAPTPTPDAETCPGRAVGEPDDQCPGESVGPVLTGDSLTVSHRVLTTTNDVDIFDLMVKLVPFASCLPGQSVPYAVRIVLTDTTDSVRLHRFTLDDTCASGLSFERERRELCIPFAALCPATDTAPHELFFAVDQNGGNETCTPYTVTVHACSHGSKCDTCTVP
jgi:hypothetical protein